MLTSEDVKVMLEVQQKAYRDCVEMLLSDVTRRLRQLEERNSELVQSLEFTQKEVDSLKEENKTLKEEMKTVNKATSMNTTMEEKINKINNKLDYMEDYSRRNNLRFEGMEEKPNETWEETQHKVQQLLQNQMEVGSVQLERAHRIGSSHQVVTRPRTVIARFTRFEDRQRTLRNSSKLKNTNIYVNEDLCEASLQTRKAQLPELRKARAEGKVAYFSHTRLIVKERREQREQQEAASQATTEAQQATVVGSKDAAASRTMTIKNRDTRGSQSGVQSRTSARQTPKQ